MISPTPDDVFAVLQLDATKRTQASLAIIHNLCRDQSDKGRSDFSIATIGKLSSANGGPSAQAIRNAAGEKYRALLSAWSSHAEVAMRKPPARVVAGVADDVLGMITDPAVRAIVGSFLAENRKLKAENLLLKSSANIVIDRRPEPLMAVSDGPSEVKISAATNALLPVEVEALQHAISEELLSKMGWVADVKTGRVSKAGHAIFRAGYITAIKKVLRQHDAAE